MMQRFAFVLLVALVALLGLSTAVHAVPIGSATPVKRETNAMRFARGLPPLPPVKRTDSMWPTHVL
jgi:hypothetical protein